MKNRKVLERFIGQIKFRPKLETWEKTMKVAQELESSYEHWRFEKEGDIILYSEKTKEVFRASYNSILYSKEDEPDYKRFLKQIKKAYEGIIERTEVSEIKHVGFRSISFYSSDLEFSELTDLTYRKLYDSGNASIQKIVGNVIDTAFILVSEKDGMMLKIQIGPMTEEEVLERFDSAFPVDNLEGESFLFFDVDVYKKDIEHPGESIRILESANDMNREIVNDFLDIVEQKI